jgi:hypothetical protein
MHHGMSRVGGERVYSVRDTILHALKTAKYLEEPSTFNDAIKSEQNEECNMEDGARLQNPKQGDD